MKNYRKKKILKFSLALAVIAGLTLIVCPGCTGHPDSQKHKAETSLVIDLEKAIPRTDALKKTGTIVLEYNEDTFPGFVHRMHVHNDTLYLLDTFKARGLYAYGPKGNFLFAYNTVGQGEGEFISLSDFQVCDNSIYLLDTSGKKIIKLDKQGKKSSTWAKLSHNALSFAFDDKGGIWLDKGNTVTQQQEAYTLLYQYEDTVEKFIPIPEELQNMNYAPYFTMVCVGNAVRFLPEMQNRIYSCKSDTVKETYYLDFGSHWPTPEFLMDNKNTNFRYFFKKMDENKYVTELNYLESESLLSLSFKCDDKAYLFFYDKKNGRQTVVENGKADELSRPMAINGKEIYFIEMTESDNLVNIYSLNDE